MRICPLRRPMLDFDDANALRANRNYVDLIRLQMVSDREGKVCKENPFAVPWNRLQSRFNVFESEQFTLIGSWTTRKQRDLHTRTPEANRVPGGGMAWLRKALSSCERTGF